MTFSLRKRWTIAAIVVATVLYIVACDNAAYEITSPTSFGPHVWLRKTYSIGAFAIVGYLFRRASAEHGATRFVLPTILAVAGYSAAIEAGQFIIGTREGLLWNAVDTVCGGIGGALATLDISVRSVRTKRT